MLPREMRSPERSGSPRRFLVVFLAVTGISAGAVGGLGWQLLKQDRALEVQRRQDGLEQAADRAAGGMQRTLGELQALARPGAEGPGALPPGVSLVTLRPAAVALVRGAPLPYRPFRPEAPAAAVEGLADGERLEFQAGDLAAAARHYARLGTRGDAAVRAGALARRGRVLRKTHDTAGAIEAYDALERLGPADVEGLPAALVARAGRASAFAEAVRPRELQAEAEALRRDLLAGRWPLTASEYEFYLAQADAWLGGPGPRNADALARAEAVSWLWQSRSSLEPAGRRATVFSSGAALVVWETRGEELSAAVAGPGYLSALCEKGLSEDLRCALTDGEGRALVGEPPPSRRVAARAARSEGLPWMLHVSRASATDSLPPSPRRRLLAAVLIVVGLVLATGWYFILRAISREMRVAQLQSDFVAAVSHEFRSPLTSISHIAEMLASGRLPSEDLRRRSYGVLVRDTGRLRRLVEGLLDFGRFDSGKVRLRLERVDVGDFVRTTVAEFLEATGGAGHGVELAVPPGPVLARADREALGRALWNLLDNAVKYSPGSRTIWVAVEEGEGRVSIVVRDQGIGIPLHEREGIFDRFVRGGESRSRLIPGTGVGLAMVRTIVLAHGGAVRVESEPGRGSTFTISLPSIGSGAPSPVPGDAPDEVDDSTAAGEPTPGVQEVR